MVGKVYVQVVVDVFCSLPSPRSPYELLLAMEGIEHRTTKIRSPGTNGFVERMSRTLLHECLRVAGRTTWYLDAAEIQCDPDRFLEYYNLQRSHQGCRLNGRTSAQALREALNITELPKLAEDEPTLDAVISNKAA